MIHTSKIYDVPLVLSCFAFIFKNCFCFLFIFFAFWVFLKRNICFKSIKPQSAQKCVHSVCVLTINTSE